MLCWPFVHPLYTLYLLWSVGVSATAKHGTEVVTIYATDKDDNLYAVNRYSLARIEYVDEELRSEPTPYAFRIDPITGVITTNATSFVKYVDGYFQMDVIATDTKGRKAQVQLFVSSTVPEFRIPVRTMVRDIVFIQNKAYR